MDHSDEKEGQRATHPHQEQSQLTPNRRQGRVQQQWPPPQRQQGYPVAPQQQSIYPGAVRYTRHQQEIPGMAAAPIMRPPPQPQEVDYHAQQIVSAGGLPVYPMHQPSAAATAAAPHYAAYPQHYQPPQLYHHQQMAIQQPIHIQQHLGIPIMEHPPPPPQPYIQPTVGRLPADRPLVKLSVSLIDTYKQINKVYYEERDARRAARAKEKAQKQGQPAVINNGWDDENYDYIINAGEIFNGRYRIKERIGKGSFGQVVRAEDTETRKDVAIKIIKSKKPFLMQAKTEIDLLTHLNEKDYDDQHNIVRLLTHFMYRNHQCLVFEMLSLNLYELLKNTQFGGVSLNLIRKFAKQILRALSFLARGDVDVIHCDLKPENILLRHPKKSAVKVIDFGSSCRSHKRMYSYIQSRFYRSPEVMLGLPYTVAIDMWSLGCILAEMHTGEPLFSGSDQFDQMQKIIKLLGMVPNSMLDQSTEKSREQFFERVRGPSGVEEWAILQVNPSAPEGTQPKQIVVPSSNPEVSLMEVIGAETHRKKRFPQSETGNSARNYELFVDLINRMLSYDPEKRIKPEAALNHPFITSGEPVAAVPASASMPSAPRR